MISVRETICGVGRLPAWKKVWDQIWCHVSVQCWDMLWNRVQGNHCMKILRRFDD